MAMAKAKAIHPIAAEVQDTFDGIYAMTESFVQNPNSAINGFIVSGDAGTGKTFTVKKALFDTNHQGNVEYIKGGKITAAALYVKLYLNRANHRIIVLDDCNLSKHPEKNQVIPMLLGAVETGRNRSVSWESARKNPLMLEHDVPGEFTFDGRIIWITNETRESIAKAIPTWKNAFLSRFNFSTCDFTDEQKFMYTMHLIENEEMLSKKCQDFKGGYPKKVVDEAKNYLSTHYRTLTEITPRIAIKVADTIHHQKDKNLCAIMLQQLWK